MESQSLIYQIYIYILPELDAQDARCKGRHLLVDDGVRSVRAAILEGF